MSLAASHAELYARMAVKDPADDGRFFIGVLSTGIYCRPSCRARLPKPENVRFFSTAQEAERAGLRACLRCRPDEFSAGREPELERIEALVDGLRADPTAFADSAALARLAGVGLSKLHALSRQHFQTSPAELVASARLERARRLLAETTKPILEVAWDSGFSSLSTFQGNFTRRHGLSPGEYRKLLGAREFELRLPQPYPLPTLLGYLGRDGESPVERVRGTAYAAGAWLAGGPGRLEVELLPGRARVRLEAAGEPHDLNALVAHGLLLRRLGLEQDPRPFETWLRRDPELAPLVRAERTGLRIPQTLSPFEAIVWVVVGQQVNLAFAFKLFRRVVTHAGREVGHGLWAAPAADEVAAIPLEFLLAGQFSGRKAEYLLGLAAEVASGRLDLGALARGSATRAERTLLAQRGLGEWSARYLLMRAFSFADCAPVGDAGLTKALARFFALDHRPDAQETRRLMARFAPFRSFATFHLWQTLEEA